jgi:hypothetical protein
LLASEDLFALEVATVGNDGQRALAAGIPGLLCHLRELGAVISDIGYRMRDDQVVLRIDCSLHIVADNASTLPAGRHRARIGVGKRDLPVRCSADHLLNRAESPHLLPERSDLFFQTH